MKYILLLPFILFSFCAAAQPDSAIFRRIDQMPEFPGGIPAIADYLGKNTVYPERARQANIEGRVVVKFIIDTDGSVTDVTVVKYVDTLLDNEAVRVIRSMPKWKPGMDKGKKVRVYYNMPVVFKLEDPEPATE